MPDTSQNEPARAEESSLEVWPPTGFRAYYTVSERIVDEPEVSYDLVLPGNFAEIDLATVRIERHGGPSDADLRFRAELYERIGAVAVAAGRVEMAMKRLLLVLTAPQKAHFSTVDHTWTTLVKKLREQCDASDSRRTQLAEVLDWSEEQEIKRRRDNVVHADWWDFAGCGVRRSRFARGKNGGTILASLADLEEDARLLFEYASRLDKLLGNDWIIARLPGPFRLREGATAAALPNPS
jgi:hypothetical protein